MLPLSPMFSLRTSEEVMAAKVTDLELPNDKGLKEMLAKFERSVSTSSVLELYDGIVAKNGAGMNPDHAKALAKRVHEIQVKTWLANNQFATKYAGRLERRADATALRKVISFAVLKAPRQWTLLCSLTNSADARSRIAGEAAVVHAKSKKLPGDAWFKDKVKALVTAKTNPGDSKTKASVYMQRIIDACERMKKRFKNISPDHIANIKKTAENVQGMCYVAEKKK